LLIDSKGELKISDFGSAKILESENETLKVSAGTPAFASPESCVPNEAYSGFTSDIWACGATLYCFLFGELPFKGENITSIYDSILKDEPSYKSETPLSQEALDLLKCLMNKDPKKRITIPEIKKSKWFEDVQEEWTKYKNDKSVKQFHRSDSVGSSQNVEDSPTTTTTTNKTMPKKNNSTGSSLFGLFRFKSFAEEEIVPRKKGSFMSTSEDEKSQTHDLLK
jgi:serine/threonine protein kinase